MFSENRTKLFFIIIIIGIAAFLVIDYQIVQRGKDTGNVIVENESNIKESLEASTIIAVVVENTPVYLDEVRYYAMTTQATYETYYIANGSKPDWNSKVDDNITLEVAVKSKLLDEICRRESLIMQATNNELKEELGTVLTESDLNEIDEKTDIFYKETSPKLIERIGISKDRLKEVFRKEALYNKLLDEAEEAGLDVDEIYEEWKKKNSISTRQEWSDIRFTKPIFTEEDLTEE